MASTSAAAAQHASTSNSAATTSASSNQNNNSRSQLKTSVGNANSAQNRRSPVDSGVQRRNSSKNAWNNNPGSGNGPKSQQNAIGRGAANGPLDPNEVISHQNHAHDRNLFLLTNAWNRSATVTTRDGARFIGAHSGTSTSTHDIGITLKQVKRIRPAFNDSQDNASQEKPVHVSDSIVFEPLDIVQVVFENIGLDDTPRSQPNGVSPSGTSFRTDGEISGIQNRVMERDLQRWDPGNATDGGLEGLGSRSNSGPVKWDQFKTNEQLFGIKSHFDENIYTTSIDKSHPDYREREKNAERIAAEIEKSERPLNSHLAEERGLALGDDSGMDEEDKYSGVQRPTINGPSFAAIAGGGSKYTPPALRAPSGQPTVPGAPVDPAIISASISRPATKAAPKPSIAIPNAPVGKTPAPAVPTLPLKPQDATKTTESKPAEKKDAKSTAIQDILGPKKSPTGRAASPSKGTLGTSVVQPAGLESDVHLKFKNFAGNERERVEKRRKEQQKKDKDVKLQDLVKFSRNFQLKTPVPKDLVPILAKDKQKQAEIVEKGQKQADSAKTGSTVATPIASPTASSSSRGLDGNVARPRRDLSAYANPKPIPPFKKPEPPRSVGMPGPGLRQQLEEGARSRQAGHQPPVPHPFADSPTPSLPPTGPSKPFSATNIPTGPANKLSARATEFRPTFSNSSFTPPQASPVHPPSQSSRATSPSAFFDKRRPKPLGERVNINDCFNPFKRFKRDAEAAAAAQPAEGIASSNSKPTHSQTSDRKNGHIPPAFVTTPHWNFPPGNEDKKYVNMFDVVAPGLPVQGVSSIPMIPQVSHQSNAPSQYAINGPHIPGAPPFAHHANIQPGTGPHGQPQFGMPPPADFGHDRHMHNVSTPPSVMPSPSLNNAAVNYGSPMPQQAHMNYPQGHYQQFAGPQVPFAVNRFGGPGYMGQGVPPGAGPMYPGGPSPHNIQYGMMQPNMGGPNFLPPNVYGSPQHMNPYGQSGPHVPPPSSQGYPSPGRHSQPMMHQGSAQGHMGGTGTPVMMPGNMPMYASTPQGGAQMNMMRGGYQNHNHNHHGNTYGGGHNGGHHPQHHNQQFPQRGNSFSSQTGGPNQHHPPSHPMQPQSSTQNDIGDGK